MVDNDQGLLFHSTTTYIFFISFIYFIFVYCDLDIKVRCISRSRLFLDLVLSGIHNSIVYNTKIYFIIYFELYVFYPIVNSFGSVLFNVKA